MIAPMSMLGQLLSLIDRGRFQKAVKERGSDSGAKGFSSWSHLVCLLFAQLAGAGSLREVAGGLAGAMGKLNHLGIFRAPNKSTLSYASKHRPWQLFEDVFKVMLEKAIALGREQKKKFKFKNPLYSIDSSTVDLCLSVFDWALYKRTKGAVKLHLMLEHQSYLPCWALVTDGKTADITAARTLSLPKGAIVDMDRGYVDFNLFSSWTEKGIYFVTRIKDRMLYEVTDSRPVPPKVGRPATEASEPTGNRVLRDETIAFTSQRALSRCPLPLRLVTIWDEAKNREMSFLSNNFKLAASTISAIYKDRWSIEAFFKAIKQNLKIKTFLGTSENAVKAQLVESRHGAVACGSVSVSRSSNRTCGSPASGSRTELQAFAFEKVCGIFVNRMSPILKKDSKGKRFVPWLPILCFPHAHRRNRFSVYTSRKL